MAEIALIILKAVGISALIALLGGLTAAGYLNDRDRYWRRIWRKLGEPDVKSTKELKALWKQYKKGAQ